MEAYCVKCKKKREIKNPEATFTSTGTPATKGVCPVCGTKLFRMGRTPVHEGLTPPAQATRTRKKKQNRRPEKRNGKLVIVESPAKARTVGRFLGNGYSVRASVGHVRDLLRSKLSVDVENDFAPKYRVPNEKREVVKELKKEAQGAKEIYLATDPDREGEAIAWHLMEAVEIDPELSKRVVFHEITHDAIEEAFDHPREIDMHLVDSQQARRILDRLVGYNLSPLLWSKVRGRLSAGRVQSAALRLVVDRENEIREFTPEEYWTIDGDFVDPEKPPIFRAHLVEIGGEKPELTTEDKVRDLEKHLKVSKYHVDTVKPGKRTRRPSPPFTTSTLQQSASRRLRFTARKTMAVAQQLYEGIELGSGDQEGLITYMRTDSTQVAKQAQEQAREVIRTLFGADHLPQKSPVYKTKAAQAQEAHEAIRPTSVARIPAELKDYLTKDQFRLYQLIWKRFLASQMKPAIYDTLTIEVIGKDEEGRYLFRVSASSIKFSGYMAVYEPGVQEAEKDDEAGQFDAPYAQLPQLEPGDPVDLEELYLEQHFTAPPNRYSEASLVKALEENGIGRPSTYAPILTTLQRRGYVIRENRRLEPTEIGELVNGLIVEHFPDIVDLGFTAKMEQDLDRIALGTVPWVEVVREFYDPFSEELEKAKELMPEVKAEPEFVGRDCPESGHPLIVRHGRYGKFIGCSNFPECRYTEPWLEKIGVTCPKCGGDVVERRTRKGRVFYGCSRYPDCDFTSWKRPLPNPCPECGGLLVVENKKLASCTNCGNQFELSELEDVDEELA